MNSIELGRVLDRRFTILRYLGSGSMGAVWLARDRGGEEVACKILHPQFSERQDVIRQMAREAQVLEQLSHPNITRPIAFGSSDGLVFLAMEFLDGRRLDEVIGAQAASDTHFPLTEVVALFGQLCEGIAYAHSQHVVHRDLKPHNIIVVDGPEGRRPKILDFGLARLVEADPFEATTFGRRLGSPFYMSPEQTRGEPATEMSDVFALGTILFELVTLRRAWARDAEEQPLPAFAGPSPIGSNALATVFERIARGPRPSAQDVRRDLPAALDRLIHRALAVDAADRPPTVDELQGALLEALPAVDGAATANIHFTCSRPKVAKADVRSTRTLHRPTPVMNDKRDNAPDISQDDHDREDRTLPGVLSESPDRMLASDSIYGPLLSIFGAIDRQFSRDLLMQPAFWMVAVVFAGGIGGAIGFFGLRPTLPAADITEAAHGDQAVTWRALEQHLAALDSDPSDPRARALAQEALLLLASSSPEHVRRGVTTILATETSSTRSDHFRRAARRLHRWRTTGRLSEGQ